VDQPLDFLLLGQIFGEKTLKDLLVHKGGLRGTIVGLGVRRLPLPLLAGPAGLFLGCGFAPRTIGPQLVILESPDLLGLPDMVVQFVLLKLVRRDDLVMNLQRHEPIVAVLVTILMVK